ncbi:MAG: WYL domain-containing protein [Rhodospirillaceae bacterium]|nr:WYL domain-containing protein [Rhodospirillaceae bacterium]
MEERTPDLRWGVEQRLEFIEFRLFWEGGINRSDIRTYFGVSVPQASKDLRLYQELAPGNMAYDKSGKRYFAAPAFRPHFLKPDPDRYLSQLRSVADGTLLVSETWLSKLPDADCLPIPHRRVDPELLRTLLAAVRLGRAVEIYYQSMNPRRANPAWREISPHAFGSDGIRWHVRAFCHIDRTFKDFLVSRCLDCRIGGELQARGHEDSRWQEVFKVFLKANPALPLLQQKIIEHDFEMNDNVIEISVRRSMLYYFKKRLRLDVAEILNEPQEAPLVIANREEFDRSLSQTE